MNRKLYLIAAAVALGSGASAVLLTDDFEGDVVGEHPASASISYPNSNSGTTFSKVVDGADNTAGTGKGLKLQTDDADTSVGVEYNFVADAASQLSAVRVDLSFAWVDLGASSHGDFMGVSLGEYNAGITLNSAAKRYIDLRFYDNGELIVRNAAGNSSYTDVSGGSHELSIFVNDGSQSIGYTGLDNSTHVLGANKAAYWLDGALFFTSDMDLDDPTTGGTVGTTEDNLGKFGFETARADVKLCYVVDDIEIASLEDNPPPLPDYLLFDTFETQTVGAKPTAVSVARPNTPAADLFNEVVDASVNTAGSGKGTRLFDNNASDGVAHEYNFVADAASQVSVAKAQFDFSCLDSNGVGDDYIAVAFGEYKTSWTLSSNSRRFSLARLYNDGTIDFTSASGPDRYNIGLSVGSHTLAVFVNDYDSQPVNYTGPDGVRHALPTNSVAYWLDGALELTTSLDLDDATVGTGGTVGTTEGNLGKFGFSSGSSDTNLDYVLDNVLVTTNFLVDTYAEWQALYPALGSSTNRLDDPDADGMDNLLEYALGGNPTLADADTVQPKYIEDGAGGWLDYVYNRRIDDGTLTYEVKADDDLVGALGGTAPEIGAGDLGNGFESVTNRISSATNPTGFMQLKVEASQ